MYQVYSQQRPGRPRWTLGASAMVLLLTLGFASGVIQYKDRALRAHLSDVKSFTRGALKCAIPAGWELVPENKLPSGIVLIAQEQLERGRAPRKLVVFRHAPRPLGTPLREGRAVLFEEMTALRLVSNPESLGVVDGSRIGALPACDVFSPEGAEQGPNSYEWVSRVAIAPAGETVGLILVTPREFEPRDRKLLDQISGTLLLEGVEEAKDAAAAMKAAGVEFTLPSDTRVFQEPLPQSGLIQLTSGIGSECWYLSLQRVPLQPGRTPAALVRDFAAGLRQDPEMSSEIETNQAQGRTFAQARLAFESRLPETILITCVQTDTQTALMMLGRSEVQAARTLQQVAQDIGATAKVTNFNAHINLEKAHTTAREWISQINQKGLRHLFGDYEIRRSEFALRAPAIRLGSESRELRADRKGGVARWELTVGSQSDLNQTESADVWRIRDDGRGHECGTRITGPDTNIKYTEKWSGQKTVHRELSTGGHAVQPSDTPVDDVFLSEPVLIEIAGAMARAQSAPAVFSTAQTFSANLSHWVVIPLGSQDVPGMANKKAPAALLQHDCDPIPLALYFDNDNSLLAVNIAGGRYQIRTRQSGRGGAVE